MHTRLDALRHELRDLGRVVVAFSGGVDSALLAWTARDVLGRDAAPAVTAVSPSLAGRELDEAAALAAAWDLDWHRVETTEMERAAYRRNDGDRCFHCKDALMDAVEPIARRLDATVVLGVNLDDLGDHRPGQRAAQQRGARFPMVDAGLTKSDVRSAAREAGLPVWDKPAAACLASRIPYGTSVTVGLLGRVERAEARLVDLGFPDLRVRHYDDTARIEVPIDRLPDLLATREAVVDAVRGVGYRYVTVDLEGLRSGNLNAALADDPA